MKQFYAKLEFNIGSGDKAVSEGIHAIEVHFQSANIVSAAMQAKDIATILGHDEDSITKLVEVPTKGDDPKRLPPRAGESGSGSWLK